jgi:hypothetical protein
MRWLACVENDIPYVAWSLIYIMRLPGKPTTWVITFLGIVLIGLAVWIAWAVQRIDEVRDKRAMKEAARPAPNEPEPQSPSSLPGAR